MARRGIGAGRGAAGREAGRDPWRDAPTGELQDQVLPRWFVLTGLALIPLALVAVAAAFLVQRDEVAPAARRPPPAGGLTTGVGDLSAGGSAPQPLGEPPCPQATGLRTAGTATDRAVLTAGIAALCEAAPAAELALLAEFAAAGGVLRFAQFQDTGVDSTATADGGTVYVNARSVALDEPAWIAPLVVHDLVTLAGEPGSVGTALAAREAEAAVCAGVPEGSRACADAAAVLALDDPAAALRIAGYR